MAIAIALLVYHYIEKPFLAVRAKYFKDDPMETGRKKVYAVDL
jgi:peptidoglycan/LPS O-acetylase OafA/YrhL